MDLHSRQELNRGLGDGLSRAFELAVTPAVFGVIGYFIDAALDLVPVFTIGLSLFAIVGMFVRMWYGYDLEMKAHEARFAARRPGAATPTDLPPLDETPGTAA